MRTWIRHILVLYCLMAVHGSFAQGNADPHVRLADHYFQQMAYAPAVTEYEVAAQMGAVNEHVTKRLADWYTKLRNTEQAEHWYSIVVKFLNREPRDLYNYAEALKSNNRLETLVLANNDLTTSSCYYWIDCLQKNRVLIDLNIEDNNNMAEHDKREVLEWVKGNNELLAMREDPDNYDLAVKTKVVRDCLFLKVSQEDKDQVITKLVTPPQTPAAAQ